MIIDTETGQALLRRLGIMDNPARAILEDIEERSVHWYGYIKDGVLISASFWYENQTKVQEVK